MPFIYQFIGEKIHEKNKNRNKELAKKFNFLFSTANYKWKQRTRHREHEFVEYSFEKLFFFANKLLNYDNSLRHYNDEKLCTLQNGFYYTLP